MITLYIASLIVVYLIGFKVGKNYILKGLSLRVEQLNKEGNIYKAGAIKEILERVEK